MIHTLLPAPLRWMLNAEYFSSGESLADTYSAGSPTVPRSFPSPPRQVSRDFPMKVPARYASTPAAGALNAARQFPSFSVYAADATVGLRASRRWSREESTALPTGTSGSLTRGCASLLSTSRSHSMPSAMLRSSLGASPHCA